MGIVSWRGAPVATGAEWPGLRYFTTLRLSARDAPERAVAQGGAAGASAAPYDTFNLGAHVGDAPQAVRANRERFAAMLPRAPVWLDQVHGVEVFDADANAGPGDGCEGQAEDGSRGGALAGVPRADAAVTTTPGRVLCIMTADCLPVVLADLRGTALGVAHAGWRGLAAGVLENTLEALRERAAGDSEWRAWIGPAIGQAAFEVGEEVRAAFVAQDAAAAAFFAPGRPDKWHADLAGLAMHRLKRAGVHEAQASGLCTHQRSDLFYSYRRDGRTGRMATAAWLHPLATYPD